nr:hypothetical protein [uncultured Desulfobacter sp.]
MFKGKFIPSIFIILLFMFIFASLSVAATVRYDITADANFISTVRIGHPVATLLNVTPDNTTISLKASLLINTESVGYVEYDTPTYQRAIYRDAIVSCNVELNGVEWSTIRTPTQYPSDIPPASFPRGEESRIGITNSVTMDQLSMQLRDTNQETPTNLFSSQIASVGQILNGVYYEDTVVGLGLFFFNDLTCDLSGYEIPSDNGFIGNPSYQAVQLSLVFAGNENQLNFGSVDITGIVSAINVSSVPVPATLSLFLSGIIGLVGFYRKTK